MVRRNINLEDEAFTFLSTFNSLTFSEHVRRAIDEYIDRILPTNSAFSASKIINKEKKWKKT
jgi:hypothetical protein